MASSPLVELEGVGGGGAGDVSSLGGVGGICSRVANLTLFWLLIRLPGFTWDTFVMDLSLLKWCRGLFYNDAI